MPRPSSRNQIIDLLRGLSLLMVVSSHYGLLNPLVRPEGKTLWGRPMDDVLAGMGFYGVSVFFVISGFLITGLSLRRYPNLREIDVRGFWWMRLARTGPMLVLCAVAMVLFWRFGLDGFLFRSSSEFAHSLGKMLTFRFNELIGKGVSPEPWSPLWSLSVEEMFYLFFPLVCWVAGGVRALRGALVGVVGVSMVLKGGKWAGAYSMGGNMDLLSFGCLLALARPERLKSWSDAQTRLLIGLGSAVVGAALVVFCVLWAHPFRPFWAPEICGLGAGLFLIASQLVELPPVAARGLLPMTVLGVVSYEAYLIHQPLREYLGDWDVRNVWLVLALVVALAIATHYFFSEPLNLALRRLRGKPPAAPDDASRKALLVPSGMTKRSWVWWASRIVLPVVGLTAAAWSAGPTNVPPFAIHFTEIKDLPPGTIEPIACIGHPGTGKLVYLEHLDGGQVRFGIDNWGQPTVVSSALRPSALTASDIIISFAPTGVQVTQNAQLQVATPSPTHRADGQPRVGVNDINFSRAMAQAASSFAVVTN